jgi:hypothetical protein
MNYAEHLPSDLPHAAGLECESIRQRSHRVEAVGTDKQGEEQGSKRFLFQKKYHISSGSHTPNISKASWGQRLSVSFECKSLAKRLVCEGEVSSTLTVLTSTKSA